MVCGREDGEWGGAVLEIRHGEEGEEWRSIELGSAEFVRLKAKGAQSTSIYGLDGIAAGIKKDVLQFLFALARFGSVCIGMPELFSL